MNPNSAHQQWSEWVFAVDTAAPAQPGFEAVKLALGRLATAVFGCCGRMKIEQAVTPGRPGARWTITLQVEGESVYQPGWRARVLQAFTLGLQRRFGEAVRVKLDVRLLAGQTVDARPNTQWLILPQIDEGAQLWGAGARRAQALGMATVPSTTRMW